MTYTSMHCSFFCLTDDLSRNKIATQSHTYQGSGYKASNAVDRVGATCMRTTDIGSTSPQKTVWWRVDLGGVYNIHIINIQFKNYPSVGMFYRLHKEKESCQKLFFFSKWKYFTCTMSFKWNPLFDFPFKSVIKSSTG